MKNLRASLTPALATFAALAATHCAMPPPPPVTPASAASVRIAVSPEVKIEGLDGASAQAAGGAMRSQLERSLAMAGYRVVEGGQGKADYVASVDAKMFNDELVTEAHVTLRHDDEMVAVADFKGQGNCGDFIGCNFDRTCVLLVNTLTGTGRIVAREGGGSRASGESGTAPASGPAPSGGGCKVDMECKGNRLCENGQCVAPR